MFSELEDIFAKWGIGLLILSAALASMLLLTDRTNTLLSADVAVGTLLIGAVMVATSFTLFRARVHGVKHNVDVLADTDLSYIQLQTLLGVMWIVLLALPMGVLALKLTGVADGSVQIRVQGEAERGSGGSCQKSPALPVVAIASS